MLLQKTFIADHLTKKKVFNRGELPCYHVADRHEGIIDKESFERVQVELAERAERFHPSPKPRKSYPFTGLIRCGNCGSFYRRKINNCGTKYAHTVWACDTFNRKGKAHCDAKMTPEDILMQETAAVLGWSEFYGDQVPQFVERIEVAGPNTLVFHLKDGRTVERRWQLRSRRESWTEEMRQKAREAAARGWKRT